MTIGIISEDKNDCDALGTIVRKIINDQVLIVPASRAGKDAIIHQKKILVSKVFNFNCDFVLIVRDSDGGSVNAIERSIKAAYDSTPIGAYYKICIAVEEIESWLLSDINCVRLTYDQLPRNSARISEPNTDDIHDPKDRLKKYISTQSRGAAQYIPSDIVRMAENIDIEAARSRSRSFGQFYDLVDSLARGDNR